jgi:cell division initiation protein
MDVTPHDLRNAELREAFRGYRPDEVEELLERAAVTLERMHERNRLLQERLAQVEQDASSGKEMESVLRQTLLLAQRTADETVASAHERARQLLEEAEDRALTLTSQADYEARMAGETQRRKYEAIVAELSSRREFLTLDINALERIQVDYRSRLRAVLQQELEDLERRPELPAPSHPELHEVDLSPVEDTDAKATTKEAKNGASGSASGESDGGPPTEALVVLEEEMAESRPPGAAARRRS